MAGDKDTLLPVDNRERIVDQAPVRISTHTHTPHQLKTHFVRTGKRDVGLFDSPSQDSQCEAFECYQSWPKTCQFFAGLRSCLLIPDLSMI